MPYNQMPPVDLDGSTNTFTTAQQTIVGASSHRPQPGSMDQMTANVFDSFLGVAT